MYESSCESGSVSESQTRNQDQRTTLNLMGVIILGIRSPNSFQKSATSLKSSTGNLNYVGNGQDVNLMLNHLLYEVFNSNF